MVAAIGDIPFVVSDSMKASVRDPDALQDFPTITFNKYESIEMPFSALSLMSVSFQGRLMKKDT